jgi:hypothetical protein
MLKKILLFAGIVIVALIGFIASRPSTFRVERSTTIQAPAEVVFAQVNDFHNWDAWSPWNELDPDMVKTFSGADMGEGAEYHWVGNDQAGEGHMTITASHPHEHVSIDLEFLKPFAASSVTAFDLAPAGEGTQVTWVMSGENSFMAKAVGLIMDMDASIGGDFEKGLGSMREVSEAIATQMHMEEGEEGEESAAGS